MFYLCILSGHEYARDNLDFAQNLEPGNQEVMVRWPSSLRQNYRICFFLTKKLLRKRLRLVGSLGHVENSERTITQFLLDNDSERKWIKRLNSKRVISLFYFSSKMTFQTEIFQGMFTTIIIIRPCIFYVNLWSWRSFNDSVMFL